MFGRTGKQPKELSTLHLADSDYTHLEEATGFNSEEINFLFKIFAPHAIIPTGNQGMEAYRASLVRLVECPEIMVLPLIHRILVIYNADKSGAVSFMEFSMAMRALSLRSTLKEKLQFTFKLYDTDNQGAIDPTEMFELLRMILGRAHSDTHLQTIVDSYLNRFPKGLTFDIFCQMFDVSDLSKLTLLNM